MLISKKNAALLLIFTLCSNVYAQENNLNMDADMVVREYIAEVSGNAIARIPSSKYVFEQNKFTAKAGHGFAAERGNTYIDNLMGRNSKVVGDNNLLNGPDRVIINRSGQRTWIQTKYCETAQKSIDAAFRNGEFRYYNLRNNKPMQIEVPSDQYVEAVRLMEEKIRNGQIEGVADIGIAKNIVRKGLLTYEQAKNLAKAGTVESLTYDSLQGTISARNGFFIGFLISYALCKYSGMQDEEALRNAVRDGFKTGAIAFGGHVILAQMVKSRIAKKYIFVPTVKALSDKLGVDLSKNIVEGVLGREALKEMKNELTIRRNAARILSNNMIGSSIFVIIMTIPEAIDYFRGRISAQQFIKNVVVIVAGAGGAAVGSVGGTAAGGYVGGPIGAKIGSVVGGIAGGAVGGAAAYFGLTSFGLEDDANEMYRVINEEFANVGNAYMLQEKDAESVISKIRSSFDDDTLKKMYQSKDRTNFARYIIEPIMAENLRSMPVVKIPSEIDMRYSLLGYLGDVVMLH